MTNPKPFGPETDWVSAKALYWVTILWVLALGVMLGAIIWGR